MSESPVLSDEAADGFRHNLFPKTVSSMYSTVSATMTWQEESIAGCKKC
jgi:hypothetical protein